MIVDPTYSLEKSLRKSSIAPEHEAQIINYEKATGIEVGLLINFGNPKLEYKRFTRRK